MLIVDYTKKVKAKYPKRTGGGKFMYGVFHAAGNSQYATATSEDYLRKIGSGDRDITDDMQSSFPKPYRIRELADYYKTSIPSERMADLAHDFNICEGTIDVDMLCISLASQFYSFVDVGGGKREVEDHVASTYRELRSGTSIDDIAWQPYYPGDRAWVMNSKCSDYAVGFYDDIDHVWKIRNDGCVRWTDRKLICRSVATQIIKCTPIEVNIPLVEPGEVIEISVKIDARGEEMTATSVWEMTDAAGNNCFPNRKRLFNIEVTVVNQLRGLTEEEA